MNETQKTMVFIGAAIAFGVLALLTTPGNPTPESFSDKGEIFFPDFTDPNTATSLEVVEFDQQTGVPMPFKVNYQGGKWTIPSHHNHPADGKDRLARTAAGVIDIAKDDIVSDNPSDHEALSVLDPVDETSTKLSGRGKRVTIKDNGGNTLADLIIGSQVAGREKFYYVRVPNQKRTYAARVDLDLSTRFSDWIEKDLLLADRAKITEVTIKDYSINERSGRLDQRDTVILKKTDETWRANRMSANQEVTSDKMDNMLGALDSLTIVGVRPKPDGLSLSLSKVGGAGISITQSDMLSLQNRGFYFTQDSQLVSNEGETQIRTEEGVVYTLRFGEVVFGTGEAVSAGTTADDGGAGGPGENRYLFITTEFDEKMFPEPKKPSNLAFQTKADSTWTSDDRSNSRQFAEHQAWIQQVERGRTTSADLNTRFAKWYYVISADSFDRVHLKRRDLVTRKTS